MEECQINTEKGETDENFNFEPIIFEETDIEFILNINYIEDIIIFSINDNGQFHFINYTTKMSFRQIMELDEAFNKFHSINDFQDFINYLSKNNKINIKKSYDKLTLLFYLEDLSKQKVIEIDLYPTIGNININDILNIKNKIEEIDSLKNENKAIKNENNNLKIQLKETIKEMIITKNKNNKLTNEINKLKNDNKLVQGLITESKNRNNNDIIKKRIVKWIKERYKIYIVRKNLKKLSILLISMQKKFYYQIRKKLINYLIIEDLFKELKNNINKAGIYKLKEGFDYIKKISYLKILFEMIDANNQILELKYYLSKWNDKSNKIKIRENKLVKCLNQIEKRKFINELNIYADASVAKKFLNIFPVARAYNFFNKLRYLEKRKIVINYKLSKILKRSDTELLRNKFRKWIIKIRKMKIKENKIKKASKKLLYLFFIENAYYFYNIMIKEYKKKIALYNIIRNNIYFTEKILKYKFNQWLLNAKKIMKVKALKICQWIDKYRKSIAKKNWIKLSYIYESYNKRQIFKRLNIFIKVYAFNFKIKLAIIKFGVAQFKQGLNSLKKKEYLIYIFENIFDNKEKLLLKYYFDRLMDFINNLIYREKKLKKGIEEIEKRQIINFVNAIFDAELTKQLLNLIPCNRDYNLFNKLKELERKRRILYDTKIIALRRIIKTSIIRENEPLRYNIRKWYLNASKMTKEINKIRIVKWIIKKYYKLN